MLILTRKKDQAIVIDTQDGNGQSVRVVVTVLRIERDRVKLGISAPEEIGVLREELLGREPSESKQGPSPATQPPHRRNGETGQQ